MEHVRRRVLIVEGDADNCEALRMILDGLGHDVEYARTGAGALSVTMMWHPDLVVLDLGLPDLPGERVAETMKRLPTPPFIVGFSGYHKREHAARSAGCDAFVLKPNLDGLLALIAAPVVGHAKADGAA
jgi:two-component system, chemotaxis family, CheB/CheR fusion protein